MADTAIKNLFKRLQVMEDSCPNPKPTGPSGEALPKNLGSPSLGIDKLKVKGGNATNLEAKPDPSRIKGLDGASASAQWDAYKNVEFDTGTELSEAEFGQEDDEDDETPPDFGGEEADLDSDLDQPFGDEDAPPEDAPPEGDEDGDGDDVDATLAHIEDLLRDAMGDETLSVSVGVNLPKGEGGEGAEEPDADDMPPEDLDDATVPEEPGLEGEPEEEDEYGADQATMESFLKEFTGSSQKKNSNEDESEESDSGKSDDSDDENEDEDDGNPYSQLGNAYATRGY